MPYPLNSAFTIINLKPGLQMAIRQHPNKTGCYEARYAHIFEKPIDIEKTEITAYLNKMLKAFPRMEDRITLSDERRFQKTNGSYAEI